MFAKATRLVCCLAAFVVCSISFSGWAETFEEISKFRESGFVSNAFQQAISSALPVYKEVAAEILGTDEIDKLPELNDPEFVGPNGMLEEIFWVDAFLKPYVRQIKKDKTPKEAFKSIKDR